MSSTESEIEMKISFDMAALVQALDLVSIVVPKASGAAGYLFKVQDDRCYLYSRDNACVARASFPLRNSDGGGSFVYPAEYVGALKLLASTSDTCEIEATQEDEKFTVRYHASSGAKAERGSFDPRLLETCDQDLEEAVGDQVYHSGLLREAISLARPFISKADGADESLKGLQVLDATKPEYAKGDGCLYTSDGTRAFYFRCTALSSKSLEMHGQHLSQFINFLNRADTITLKKGKHFTFAVDSQGNVFGWPKHTKGHGKFGYYSLASDQYILTMPKVRITTSLMHIRSELDSKEEKIKVNFDPERRTLTFEVAAGSAKVEGIPILVAIKQAEPDQKPWTFGANINHFLELVNATKGHEVELRVRVLPATGERRNDVAMFRTIESFNIDASGKVVVESEGAFECQVTRFMPSKN